MGAQIMVNQMQHMNVQLFNVGKDLRSTRPIMQQHQEGMPTTYNLLTYESWTRTHLADRNRPDISNRNRE
jgi:hypothetical protein